jgi:hypothetical protein
LLVVSGARTALLFETVLPIIWRIVFVLDQRAICCQPGKGAEHSQKWMADVVVVAWDFDVWYLEDNLFGMMVASHS